MPVDIPNNPKEKYLDYFRDEARFKTPSRDPKEYNVADDFFNNLYHSKKSLASLLQLIPYFPPPKGNLEQNVYAEFTVTAHAKVMKALGQDDEIKLLVGQTALMLEKGKEGTHKAIGQSRNADPNSLVITSDLARAIHHGLLKYSPEIEDELDCFADRIDEEFRARGGAISRDTHVHLVKLALDHGIIPTPLLRSHYHGMRDLTPEKYEQFVIDDYLKSDICSNLYKEKSEDEVRAILTLLRNLAEQGKSPFQVHEDEDGKILTENLLLYTDRVSHLLQFFAPGRKLYDLIEGRKINLIGHSSNIDVITAYFRHFGEELRLNVEKTDKAKTRGKEVVIKVDSNFEYLNNPKRLYPLIKEAQRIINKLRGRSVDPLIKEKGAGILSTPLLGFGRKEKTSEVMEEYESYPETLESALISQYPIVIFGHGGQGKSILSTEIAKRFLEGRFGKTYENYIPVFLDCEAVGKAARSNKDTYGDTRMESIITKQIYELKLPKVLLKEYKFVFILDDYQKLSSDYTKEMEAAITKLKKEGNLVILLSRLEKIDVHPPHNPGYKTMQIDLDGIAKQTDEFIEGRIPSKDVERFKEYLSQYDTSITGNYMTKLFLTMIFPTGNGKSTGVTDYVIDPLIQIAIKEGKPLTQTQLYDAQTDYVSAQDILRIHPELPLSEVRRRIVELKNELAEKSFNHVFGKNAKK